MHWIWIVSPIAMLAIGTPHFVATKLADVSKLVRSWKANPIVALLLKLETPDGKQASLEDEGWVLRKMLDQKVALLREEA
jgi:hypothetical protein